MKRGRGGRGAKRADDLESVVMFWATTIGRRNTLGKVNSLEGMGVFYFFCLIFSVAHYLFHFFFVFVIEKYEIIN